MKTKHLKLLGKKVMPIVKRHQYGAASFDHSGNLTYLQGAERRAYAKRVVDDATKEQRRINKEQDWQVFSVNSDGTFTLRSDMGYEQAYVNRNDFRLSTKK